MVDDVVNDEGGVMNITASTRQDEQLTWWLSSQYGENLLYPPGFFQDFPFSLMFVFVLIARCVCSNESISLQYETKANGNMPLGVTKHM